MKFALWDIYNLSPGASYNNKEFFNYKSAETGRFLDASIACNFGEKFPLTVSWATVLFGRDRNAANTENKYSTFVYAEYPVLRAETWGLSAGIGGAFALNECGSSSHFYGDKPGIVHIQIKGSYHLKITDKYTLPLHTMVMFNPEGDRAFYQIGATLFSF